MIRHWLDGTIRARYLQSVVRARSSVPLARTGEKTEPGLHRRKSRSSAGFGASPFLSGICEWSSAFRQPPRQMPSRGTPRQSALPTALTPLRGQLSLRSSW